MPSLIAPAGSRVVSLEELERVEPRLRPKHGVPISPQPGSAFGDRKRSGLSGVFMFTEPAGAKSGSTRGSSVSST